MHSSFCSKMAQRIALLLPVCLFGLVWNAIDSLQVHSSSPVSRRMVWTSSASAIIAATTTTTTTGWLLPSDWIIARADEGSGISTDFGFEARDRKNNKDAIIREDYWYMMGKAPPRLLKGPVTADDPQWSTFGSCTSQAGGNPCTYVSLQQRIPAYGKYGSSIAYGAQQFQKLGSLLNELEKTPQQDSLWMEAKAFVQVSNEKGTLPPPAVDAELKMVLLATALVTSPNFPGPNRELLVARFYANEVHYAHSTLAQALAERDLPRARAAYDFGKDSWNSYFQVVNRSISTKVGEKFEAIV